MVATAPLFFLKSHFHLSHADTFSLACRSLQIQPENLMYNTTQRSLAKRTTHRHAHGRSPIPVVDCIYSMRSIINPMHGLAGHAKCEQNLAQTVTDGCVKWSG
jgi:hypothetical protein